MSALVTHRSMVNTWHCDEMGHMNVRHYVAKADSATAHLANMLGLGPRALAASGLRLRTADHHVRYIREMHAGNGLYIQSLLLAVSTGAIRFCHEIRRSMDGSISATLTGDLELVDAAAGTLVPFPAEVCARAGELVAPLPDYAAPRGLSLARPAVKPTLARANELGLFELFRGTVETAQCDSNGFMLPSNVIASISDGVPNLFRQNWGKAAAEPESREIGGAAVEYRMFYHRCCPAGSLLVIRGGMVAMGEKTLHHAHCLFDAESGEAIASAQAIAVSFDLVNRRAIAVPEAARSHYQTLIIPGLGLL